MAISPHSAQRVRGYGVSVFAEMSALARELNAVNLGQGFPDFEGPEEIKEAAREALTTRHNQYAVSHGEPMLREAIAEHSARFYGQTIDANTEVTVTSGAAEGIMCALFALVNPGDEVIIFEPCYDSYVPNIQMAGGTAVPITLRAPNFRFDPDELRAAFSSRTKAILLNTPHNPTGTVFSEEELLFIAQLCQEWDVIAITDEVYEHIVYQGAKHIRLATLPGMWERTLTLSSGGKTFSFTGWKIGWAIGPFALQKAFRTFHQFNVFSSPTPLQYAIATGLGLPDSYFDNLASDYQARRDFLMDALLECGLLPTQPMGSYFVLADISNFSYANSLDFCRYLVKEVGVAAIPPASFYMNQEHGEKLVRFCYCKSWEVLQAGVERLKKM